MANRGTSFKTTTIDPILLYRNFLLGSSAFGLICGTAGIAFGEPVSIGLSGLALGGGILGLQRQHTVPAIPPHCGIMTLWGSRSTARLLPPGDYPIFREFPVQIGIDNVNLEDKNTTFEVDCDVLLKETKKKSAVVRATTASAAVVNQQPGIEPGGEVRVEVGFTWVPDDRSPERLFKYIQAGVPTKGTSTTASQKSALTGGVIDNLHTKISNTVRIVVGTLSWKEALFIKERLTAILIVSLCGEPVKKWKRNPQNALIDASGAMTTSPEQFVQDGEWTKDELTLGCDNNAAMLMDVRLYIHSMLEGEHNDIESIGIILKQLKIEKITPLGDLVAVAAASAREQAEAEALDIEQNRLTLRAEKIVKSSKGTITLAQAYEIAQVQDRKITKDVTERRVTVKMDGAIANSPIVNALVQAGEVLGNDVTDANKP